jgi:hypothetical protein
MAQGVCNVGTGIFDEHILHDPECIVIVLEEFKTWIPLASDHENPTQNVEVDLSLDNLPKVLERFISKFEVGKYHCTEGLLIGTVRENEGVRCFRCEIPWKFRFVTADSN